MKLVKYTLLVWAALALSACNSGGNDSKGSTQQSRTKEEVLTPFLKQFNQFFLSQGEAANYVLDSIYYNELLSNFYSSALEDKLHNVHIYLEGWSDSDIRKTGEVLANMLDMQHLSDNQYLLTFNTDNACADASVRNECISALNHYAITANYISSTDGSLIFKYDGDPILELEYGANSDHFSITVDLEESINLLAQLGYDRSSLPDSLEGKASYSVTTANSGHIKISLATPEAIHFYNNGNDLRLPQSDQLLTIETDEQSGQLKLSIQLNDEITSLFYYDGSLGEEWRGSLFGDDIHLDLTLDNTNNSLAINNSSINKLDIYLRDRRLTFLETSLTPFNGIFQKINDPFYGNIYQISIDDNTAWSFYGDDMNAYDEPVSNGISDGNLNLEYAVTGGTILQKSFTSEFEAGRTNRVVSGKLKAYKAVDGRVIIDDEILSAGDTF
ncbi:hypothetical protein [Gynuella sp.]|uniref:hypothetical protein n=1 Tax=Gynuella sp. TaxID=2969146 RepID=UPI003D128D8B